MQLIWRWVSLVTAILTSGVCLFWYFFPRPGLDAISASLAALTTVFSLLANSSNNNEQGTQETPSPTLDRLASSNSNTPIEEDVSNTELKERNSIFNTLAYIIIQKGSLFSIVAGIIAWVGILIIEFFFPIPNRTQNPFEFAIMAGFVMGGMGVISEGCIEINTHVAGNRLFIRMLFGGIIATFSIAIMIICLRTFGLILMSPAITSTATFTEIIFALLVSFLIGSIIGAFSPL